MNTNRKLRTYELTALVSLVLSAVLCATSFADVVYTAGLPVGNPSTNSNSACVDKTNTGLQPECDLPVGGQAATSHPPIGATQPKCREVTSVSSWGTCSGNSLPAGTNCVQKWQPCDQCKFYTKIQVGPPVVCQGIVIQMGGMDYIDTLYVGPKACIP
jgi:hypothetical protein